MLNTTATARSSVIPGFRVNVDGGRLIVSDRLSPVTPAKADGALLVAFDPGDLGNRWPVQVTRFASDAWEVSGAGTTTIVHVRRMGFDLVLSAPGRCRAGTVLANRELTGADITDAMDITDREVAATIAAFANWYKGGFVDGR